LGHLWGNPVISDKDKLKELEKVVRSSDAKIKPILSPEQQAKLEQMREEQKQELHAIIAKRKADRHN
jgi:Spy/CpxP family protein refolding chaperone